MDDYWIWTSIASAIVGAAFLKWFKNTKAAVYLYNKFNNVLNYIRDELQFSFLKKSINAWEVNNPEIHSEIQNLKIRIKKLEQIIDKENPNG